MAVAIAAAACVAMAPSLRGGFLSGDDYQFVRDHVLVNRPSLPHAGKLFSIVHRDLYQPVPLLSLQVDYAVIRALGFPPEPGTHPAGVWWFHLTNVLLHAGCAVLVFALVRRFARDEWIGFAAAVLFAVHPLAAETVAWVSGRMMLLSTLFALGAALAYDRLAGRPNLRTGVIALSLVALCMMSKVRVSLPLLVCTGWVLRAAPPPRGWWAWWAAGAALTVGFAGLNLYAGGEFISGGAEQFAGSRVARSAAAIGWYLTRIITPVGLSPLHPAPPDLGWSDGLVLVGVVAIVAASVAAVISARKTRVGWVGLGWFAAAIVSTLPLFASRNLLVAERYAYLSNVGLFWIVGAAAAGVHRRLTSRTNATVTRNVTVFAATVIFVALIAVSWRTVAYYRDNVTRSARFADLYGHIPGQHVRHGWSLLDAGRPQAAIAEALIDYERHGESVACDAHQLIAMAHLAEGRTADAIESLQKAIAADPENGMANYRLALALERNGQMDQAIEALTRAAKLLPNYSPAILRLADILSKQGRFETAAELYVQALENNPYDPHATMALAELEINLGQFDAAAGRLAGLLNWMPEHPAAWVNLGVCRAATGQFAEAAAAYQSALQFDPDAKTAVLNLAALFASQQPAAAAETLIQYLQRHPADMDVLLAATRVLLPSGGGSRALILWQAAIREAPDKPLLRGWYAWTLCMVGAWDDGERAAEPAARADEDAPPAWMVVSATRLRKDDAVGAEEALSRLIESKALESAELFDAYAALLQSVAAERPEDPWPYYLLCRACVASGRRDVAELAAQEFKQRTSDAKLHARIDEVMAGGDAPGEN